MLQNIIILVFLYVAFLVTMTLTVKNSITQNMKTTRESFPTLNLIFPIVSTIKIAMEIKKCF